MSLDVISEEELRAALRPLRPDREAFEARVRERLQEAEERQADDPLWRASPLVRAAAALLPLEVLAGCKVVPAAAKAASAATGYKLLSYLAFPAMSLFTLFGAATFSAWKIRELQESSGPQHDDALARAEAMTKWQKQGSWKRWAVVVVSLALALFGASWLLFLFYIVSFGILLYVLKGLARLGLGSREFIARSCSTGLMFLGQIGCFVGIGASELHFIDQHVVGVVFFLGVLMLLPFGMQAIPLSPLGGAFRSHEAERAFIVSQRFAAAFMAPLLVGLIVFEANPIIWPATRAGMKKYVESFAVAPHYTSSWHDWEIVARWVNESKLNPDLTQPRRLLSVELAGEQNPFILGTALRTGLLRADDLGQLRDYQKRRDYLLNHPAGLKPQVITSIEQYDWVIRAVALRNDLSPSERDYLEARLHATLQDARQNQSIDLHELLLVTELLDAIGRPVDRNQYRPLVHDLLRNFHTKDSGGFEFAGGFKKYVTWRANSWVKQTGSLDSTADAVELMQIYGVPESLDLNWVRSFLRPSAMRFGDRKWMAAATLDRLNQLPGVKRPSWFEVLYYERSLLAACVLVGLCVYATVATPKSKTAAGSQLPVASSQ